MISKTIIIVSTQTVAHSDVLQHHSICTKT